MQPSGDGSTNVLHDGQVTFSSSATAANEMGAATKFVSIVAVDDTVIAAE